MAQKLDFGSRTAFVKNVIWQYGLQIVKYVFPLITLPYLARVLSPEGYAIYAYVVSFMTFVQVFVDFGFNLLGTKEITHAKTLEEKNACIGAICQARILLALLACMPVFVIASLIQITSANLTYVMFAYVAVCLKSFAPDFIFQGHENMKPLTSQFMISKTVSTALIFVFVHSIDDLLWIPFLDILSSLIALTWAFYSAKRLFGTTISFVGPRRVLKELNTSGLYCFSHTASIVFTSFTTLLIGIVVTDAAEISYWSLSMTAVSAVQALYAPISNSLYPHIIKSKDFHFVSKIAKMAIPVVLLGSVAFALLSRIMMLILGGAEYLDGAWVMVWVSPLLFLSFFSVLFGWPVLGAADKVAEVTKSTVGSAIFCVVALLLFYTLDVLTLQLVCIVRCVTELVLLLSRLWYAKELFEK